MMVCIIGKPLLLCTLIGNWKADVESFGNWKAAVESLTA